MSLVVLIAFEYFFAKIIERFHEYNIDFVKVNFIDIDEFLNTNRIPIKIFIVSGAKRRILRDGIHTSIDRILKMPIPVIGLCYGFQYMAMRSGGVLEDGANKTKMTSMHGTVNKQNIRMWIDHFDKVKSLTTKQQTNAEFKVLWKIDSVVDGTIYMAHTDKWIGFQFHPEYKKKHFEEFILPLLV